MRRLRRLESDRDHDADWLAADNEPYHITWPRLTNHPEHEQTRLTPILARRAARFGLGG